MSAVSTRRRSTRSAAQAGIQPAVAMSATTKKVRITRIVLLLYSACVNSRNGYFFNTADELTSGAFQSRAMPHSSRRDLYLSLQTKLGIFYVGQPRRQRARPFGQG